MKILLLGLDADAATPERAAQVRELAPGYRVLVTQDRAEMERVLDDIEIAAGSMPHDLLVQAPNLRWFQQWYAGADWLMRYPAAIERPFVLTNASGVHGVPISEHIFALLLAFARRIPQAVRAQEQSQWQTPKEAELFELTDKTMLLIGVGAIGEHTARVAAALGMRVIGLRREPVPMAGIDRVVGPGQLLDVLPEADFIVLTVPLTGETRHMIDAAAFARMKPAAYLVNIGRGGTVDEDALAQALREHRIAGAALDVFEREPLPADSPLWKLDNLLITAHYAGNTPRYDERAFAIFLDNLRRYQAGGLTTLRNIVDKHLGY